MEPVLVLTLPALLANVLERPKLASYMVEHAVKNYLYTVFVQRIADLLEVLVGTESAVNLGIIRGIISMIGRFKDRSEIYSITAELFDMRDIVYHAKYAANRLAFEVIGLQSTAVAERVDVVE